MMTPENHYPSLNVKHQAVPIQKNVVTAKIPFVLRKCSQRNKHSILYFFDTIYMSPILLFKKKLCKTDNQMKQFFYILLKDM